MLDLKLLKGHQTANKEMTVGEPLCKFVNVLLCRGGAGVRLFGLDSKPNLSGHRVFIHPDIKLTVSKKIENTAIFCCSLAEAFFQFESVERRRLI